MSRATRELLACALGTALAVAALLAWLRPTPPADTTVADNAYRASLALLAQRRDASDTIAAATQALARDNARLRARVAALGGDLRDALDSADAVRSDSNLTLYVERLEAVAAQARVYVDSTDALLAHVELLSITQQFERTAWQAERAAADSALAAADARAAAWQRKASCRLGPVPCPTRTQSALGTALLMLLLL